MVRGILPPTSVQQPGAARWGQARAVAAALPAAAPAPLAKRASSRRASSKLASSAMDVEERESTADNVEVKLINTTSSDGLHRGSSSVPPPPLPQAAIEAAAAPPALSKRQSSRRAPPAYEKSESDIMMRIYGGEGREDALEARRCSLATSPAVPSARLPFLTTASITRAPCALALH